ncbi:uncharacterized protein [Lepisosteus oculatus]|uniref:uncharacterized protein n=1 Tax=Lepisosteus oculatus TaxID=7918 RepID=UPI0035F52426
MMMGWVLLFSALLWAGPSSAQSGTEETKTLLLGEHLYIPVPTNQSAEVLFQPATDPDSSRALMAEGRVLEPRCLFHNESGQLVLRNVTAADSGVYLVRLRQSWYIANITVMVRDCFTEHLVQTGGSLELALREDVSRLLLEFEPLPSGGNETLVLLNRSQTPDPRYLARVSVGSRHWSLHAVTAGDQGVYIVRDWEGRELDRVCLVLREPTRYADLPWGGTLKMDLAPGGAAASLLFTPDGERAARVLVRDGEVADLRYGRRLLLEGGLWALRELKPADGGLYQIADPQGRAVASIYARVQAYKLPPLYVAILSLLGVVALLLCVCLVSCLFRIRRRELKAKAIARIAQEAGKGDGEAFRQVVQEVYTRFSEDQSTSQSVSQWEDKPSYREATEEEAKGPEASKTTRYHALADEKNFLESSEPECDFHGAAAAADTSAAAAALPLESDTDLSATFTSAKLNFGPADC